ncbi:MAG TPA: zinc ribbon domain-containing protein [Dehalococcoidia bacterium]|nr:zinc ribbon domain-containing protein [Dehalococcoidia bacterium]
MKECPSCGNPIAKAAIYCPYCGARLADLGHTLTKGNEQRQKLGLKMQKCPLCNKKIRKDAKFCSECGWDLTDHELTPPQIARIQEEIQDARSRYMYWHVAMIPFVTLAFVCILVAIFANEKVIPATWDFMLYVGLAFLFAGLACTFPRERYKKKQDRLKMMLRDRHSSQ